MGTVKSLIRIIIIASGVALFLKAIPAVMPYPHGTRLLAEKRMFMPPTFPYGNMPPGYTSSGLLCPLFRGGPFRQAYFGGWFNRACQGPLPPFIWPSTTTTTAGTTTSKPVTVVPTTAGQQPTTTMPDNGNPFAFDGEPIEGSPWEPDDEDMFIENYYGRSAADPNFRLGDPSRRLF